MAAYILWRNYDAVIQRYSGQQVKIWFERFRFLIFVIDRHKMQIKVDPLCIGRLGKLRSLRFRFPIICHIMGMDS